MSNQRVATKDSSTAVVAILASLVSAMKTCSIAHAVSVSISGKVR